MAKIYIVRLDESERDSLERMARSGKHAARKLTRARVLLADVNGSGQTDVQIAQSLGVTTRTVENLRRRCVLEGLEAGVGTQAPNPPLSDTQVRRRGKADRVGVRDAPAGPSPLDA